VGDEQRHRDRQRDRQDGGEDGGEDGAEGERRDVVEEGLALRQFGGAGGDRRRSLGDQEDRDAGEQGEDRDRADRRRVGEDPVAPTPFAARGRGEQLAGVGGRVDVGLDLSSPLRAGGPAANGGAP
jgi:hypothetical protein